MTIDTNDNRFHALKFALATSGIAPHEVTTQAEAYLRFLESKPDAAPLPDAEEPVELDDLTQSYPTEAETTSVMAEDAPVTDETEIAGYVIADFGGSAAVNAVEGSASAWLEDQFEAIDAGQPNELFGDESEATAEPTTDEIAAEVTAAVAAIADPAPATEDATDEPELTNEQAERVEELLAEATPTEAQPTEAQPTEAEKPESALAKAGFWMNRAFA